MPRSPGRAAVVSLALLVASRALAQDASAIRTYTIHTDEVALPNDPHTLSDLLERYDAVIRVRVVSATVTAQREAIPPGLDPNYGIVPETDQTVEVLEILKPNRHLPAVQSRVEVIQPIGAVLIDGVRVVKDPDRIRAWLPGEEHVLFVKWEAARSRFVATGEDSSFLLSSGLIATSGRFPVASAERGAAVPDFLARLRAAAATLPRRYGRRPFASFSQESAP